MTKDKTVTMSRELADLRKLAEQACGTSNDSPEYKRFLTAMNPTLLLDLTAPVVERQVEPVYQDRYGGGWIDIDRAYYDECLTEPEEHELRVLYTSPPAPVAADELQAIQDRHEAWIAGVEQGKAESELGAIKESEEFEKWRNAQIDVLIRNGYPEGAEAFRNLGSVQLAGWQARACLDKVKEMN